MANTVHHLRQGEALADAIEDSMQKLQKQDEDSDEVEAKVKQALELAESEREPGPEVVEEIGEGWVAEEALAVSLYCALVAEDFREGVLLAVNHGGDSDSTGAITGNLLGTLMGEGAIPSEWKKQVELGWALRRMGEDLYRYCFEFSPEYSIETEAPEIPDEWAGVTDRYPLG